MKGTRRKVVAILTAVALVLAGASFVPTQVKAESAVGGQWTTIGSDGWQYWVSKSGNTYTGGTSFDDPLIFTINTYAGHSNDLQLKTPTQSVTANTLYNMSMTVNSGKYIGGVTVNIWVNGSKVWTKNSAVAANTDVQYATQYTPTTSGTMYIEVLSGWTPDAAISFTALCEAASGTTSTTTTPAPTTGSDGYYMAELGDWATVPNGVFEYKFHPNMTDCKVKGGETLNDNFYVKTSTAAGKDHDFQTKSPVVSVTAGYRYKLTYNITATKTSGQQVYAVVTDASNDNDITSNYNNKITVTAGETAQIELTYTAPASGEVYFKLNNSWTTSNTTFTLHPVNTQIDVTTTTTTTTLPPGTYPCTQNDWSYAQNNGWQYFVKNANSTYTDGNTMAGGLTINYGDYLADVDSCQARTPVTAVNGGVNCTGSITVSNGSTYKMSDAVAAVYAVDTSTTPYTYTWYQNSEEGEQDIAANGSTTWTFDYVAPDTGYVVYVADTHYTPTGDIGFTATHEEEETTTTTIAGTPCQTGDWYFAQSNGWQYSVAGAGSYYTNGGTMAQGLGIHYGTYVEDAHTCSVRTPITAVAEGSSCTGTITIANSTDYTIGAARGAIYAVDTSTNPYTYTWYGEDSGGDKSIPSGSSATFNFSYTAPATGYVVYVADIDYAPSGDLAFSATHSEETVEPTTTTAGPTTTPYITTSDSRTWTQVPDNTATSAGIWTVFAAYDGVNNWAQTAYNNYVSNPTQPGDTSFKIVNPAGWLNWLQTITLENYCDGKLTPGNPYKITINVRTTAGTAPGKKLRMAIDNIIYDFQLEPGDNTLVVDEFTYASDSSNIAFDLGEMERGAIIDVKSITFEDNPDTTTVTPTTTEPVVEIPDIDLAGYQISTINGGFRLVGQVEPTINSKTVSSWGIVYGLSKVGKASGDPTDTGITDDDMVVGSENTYIRDYTASSGATINEQMGSSSTATYYALVMKFGKKNRAAFTSQYKARAFARLSDNSIVYGDVYNFTVFDIAKHLYDNCQMNTLADHNYLYTTILTKVDADYSTVDYEWDRIVAKPGEIGS